MAKHISIRELKKNLDKVISDAKAHSESYVVLRCGKSEAVLRTKEHKKKRKQ